MKKLLQLRVLSVLTLLSFCFGSAFAAKYTKITTAAELTPGKYLIVYTTGKYAFNGSISGSSIDAAFNCTEIKINGDDITDDSAIYFTIAAVEGGYSIQSASGYYIGGKSTDANGMQSSTTEAYVNTISFDKDGYADIVSTAGTHLRFNSNTNNLWFRYFKSSTYTDQGAVNLYKEVVEGGEDPGEGGEEPGEGGDTPEEPGEVGDVVTWVAAEASDNPGNAKDWFTSPIDSYTSWSATKGGNNNPKYYNTGSGLRVYNGGTFTVTSSKKLASITLTFDSSSTTFSTDNTEVEQTVKPNDTSYSWNVNRTCRLQKVTITYAAEVVEPGVYTVTASEDGEYYSGDVVTLNVSGSDVKSVLAMYGFSAPTNEEGGEGVDNNGVFQDILFAKGKQVELTLDHNIGSVFYFMGAYAFNQEFASYEDCMAAMYDEENPVPPVYQYPSEDDDEEMAFYTIIEPTVAVFDKAAGNYDMGEVVTISAEKATAICYSVNGEDAVEVNGAEAQVTLTANCTIAATAMFGNWAADKVEVAYTVTRPSNIQHFVLTTEVVPGEKYILVGASNDANNNILAINAGFNSSYLGANKLADYTGSIILNEEDNTLDIIPSLVAPFTFETCSDGYAMKFGDEYVSSVVAKKMTMEADNTNAKLFATFDEDNQVQLAYDGTDKDGNAIGTISYNASYPRFLNYNSSSSQGHQFLYTYAKPAYTIDNQKVTHNTDNSVNLSCTINHSNSHNVAKYHIWVERITLAEGTMAPAREAAATTVAETDVYAEDLTTGSHEVTISNIDLGNEGTVNLAVRAQAVMKDGSSVNSTDYVAEGAEGNTGLDWIPVDTSKTEGETTGVENISEANGATAEYFNLQGVRVLNPENGVFVRRMGNKVEKVVIR